MTGRKKKKEEAEITCMERLQLWKFAVMFSLAKDRSRSLGKFRNNRLDGATSGWIQICVTEWSIFSWNKYIKIC